MTRIDLNSIQGRTFPAGRTTKNIAGGESPIRSKHFSMGMVVLEPNGGQVPWHNHDQEEVYLVLEGEGEICVGDERQTLTSLQAVFVPSGVFHQLTNVGASPLLMVYCYGPSGDVSHWRQELEGTLPLAGTKAPPLPPGARPQRHL